jgi:hypothetical protein
MLINQAAEYNYPTLTCVEMEAYCFNTVGCSHVGWTHATGGTSAQNWTTGNKPALDAVSWRIKSAFPTNVP